MGVHLDRCTGMCNCTGTQAWAPAGIFVGGSEPQKGPPQDEKGPPPKKKIVLAPFLGGSEACSPEKKLTVVFPTTF